MGSITFERSVDMYLVVISLISNWFKKYRVLNFAMFADFGESGLYLRIFISDTIYCIYFTPFLF